MWFIASDLPGTRLENYRLGYTVGLKSTWSGSNTTLYGNNFMREPIAEEEQNTKCAQCVS